MPTTCDVEFPEHPPKVFYGGQTLLGQATIKVENKQKTKGIYIIINGKAHCEWETRIDENVHYNKGNEKYLECQTNVLGNGRDEIDLLPGTHVYTFECNLPPGLPSSIEGKCGYIRYNVKVVIIRSWKSDKIFEEPFTVVKAANLNNDPFLRNPVSFEKEKNFCLTCLLCCWQLQPLKIIGSLPVTGFSPGQKIDFIVAIENNSHGHFKKLIARLIKEVSFHADNSSEKRQEKTTIREKKIKKSTLAENPELKIDFDIPPLPPTDLTSSKVCKVLYFIEVTGVTGWCQGDIILRMPITIGSYPIQDSTVTTFDKMVNSGLQNSTNIGVIPKQSPPSYEEAQYSRTDINSVPFPASDPPVLDADQKEHPKYPVYHQDTPYSHKSP